mmetsp:Transcript_31739/g.79721  ORF Transcript_31739/g.79721 Transcript_31739/m.79721 type:complete len:234 (-) Transcript_31739:2761-3462(-)
MGRQCRARHLSERAQGTSTRGVDGRRRQLGKHRRQDLGLRPQHLLEPLQRHRVGVELGQQCRHNVRRSVRAAVTEHRVERGPSRVAHALLGVAQRVANHGHHVSVVGRQLVLARGCQHLCQPQAHPLARLGPPALQPAAKDGKHLGQHALAELAHEFTQAATGGSAAVVVVRAEARDEALHKPRQDRAERPRRVGYHRLPDVHGGVAHHRRGITAQGVHRGEQVVVAVLSERP